MPHERSKSDNDFSTRLIDLNDFKTELLPPTEMNNSSKSTVSQNLTSQIKPGIHDRIGNPGARNHSSYAPAFVIINKKYYYCNILTPAGRTPSPAQSLRLRDLVFIPHHWNAETLH